MENPVPGLLSGGKEILMKWGLPIAGLAGGYFAGNMLSYRINAMWDSLTLGAQLTKWFKVTNVWQIYYLIDAAIFAVAGTAIMRMVAGPIGKFAGFLFYGMAISALISAASGYSGPTA